MTQATDTRLIERALRRIDGFPQTGSGTIDATGRGTIKMDPAPQVLINPDGPALASRIESLTAEVARLREAAKHGERALQSMMDAWLDYHDAHSLTQSVTGAAGNAFDKAFEARDGLWTALGDHQ